MKHPRSRHNPLCCFCHLSRLTQIFILLLILSSFPLILLYFHGDFSSETEIEEFLYELQHSVGTNSSEAECASLSNATQEQYPQCLAKLAWMKRGWKTHQCYQDHGADNTVCSHREYLSKIERFCPPMNLRKSKFSVTKVNKLPPDYAQMNLNMTDLFSKMSDVPRNYIYQKKRIERMWSQWSKAATINWEKHPATMNGRRKQNILVHMGFLAKESKLNFAEKSNEGGPLGELLQWSDLIASLHILGHQLYISTDKGTLKSVIEEAERAPPCPTMDGKSKRIDLIITDIMGLRGLKKHRAFLVNNKSDQVSDYPYK